MLAAETDSEPWRIAIGPAKVNPVNNAFAAPKVFANGAVLSQPTPPAHDMSRKRQNDEDQQDCQNLGPDNPFIWHSGISLTSHSCLVSCEAEHHGFLLQR